MIVPGSRLLWCFALVMLPCSLAVASESLRVAALIPMAGLMAVALWDAMNGRTALRGISAHLPELVRLAKDRPGALELRIRNTGQRARSLRVGLPLPPQLRSDEEEMIVILPEGSEFSQLSWRLVGATRGSFHLRYLCLEGESRLRLWKCRSFAPVICEVRVYPNLHSECRKMAALFLNRGNFGIHQQRRVGKGREFEKLREYIRGDSLDEIHWKATAKRGHLVTKLFQIERTQEVYVLIDGSRLSARPLPVARESSETGGEPSLSSALERFVVSGLVLGLAAEQQGDLFGLVTFSNRVHQFVRARNGRAHFAACRDAVYAMEPASVSPDFEELSTFVRLRLRKRALLVFLTALDDPVLSESFVRGIELLSRQHLIQVHMIQPAGVEPLFSQPATDGVESIYRQLGGHLLWRNLRELGKVLERRGVQFAVTRNENLTAQMVSKYLAVKQRQLL
jgi:uncharacterized protein (DUF58 family)